MSPTLAVVSVEKVKEKQGVLEIQKRETFVQLACLVYRQVLNFILALKFVIDFGRQLLLVVLVGNIAQHDVSALVFATLYLADGVRINNLVLLLALAGRLRGARVWRIRVEVRVIAGISRNGLLGLVLGHIQRQCVLHGLLLAREIRLLEKA